MPKIDYWLGEKFQKTQETKIWSHKTEEKIQIEKSLEELLSDYPMLKEKSEMQSLSDNNAKKLCKTTDND